MKSLFRGAGAAIAVAASVFLFPASARASTITLADFEQNLFTAPFGQCHNDKCNCGGIQIDWDGLGFDAGNPHGAVHIDQFTIGMSTQVGDFGGLTKMPGDKDQPAAITLMNGPTANFYQGDHPLDFIKSMTLQSVGQAHFDGKQLRPLCQDFVLTIVTSGGTFVFDLCSIQGSEVNFDAHGLVKAVNFRFCGTLVSGPTPPPPVPEPASLLLLGLGGLGATSSLRRRLRKA
jgi:hypothetical protein